MRTARTEAGRADAGSGRAPAQRPAHAGRDRVEEPAFGLGVFEREAVELAVAQDALLVVDRRAVAQARRDSGGRPVDPVGLARAALQAQGLVGALVQHVAPPPDPQRESTLRLRPDAVPVEGLDRVGEQAGRVLDAHGKAGVPAGPAQVLASGRRRPGPVQQKQTREGGEAGSAHAILRAASETLERPQVQ